ncbi:MAG: hypothetical protein HKN48_02460 [Flavobacteriaceae bacterium]|nr:hypothetical protein [Flavobacteriaceae bacterium]
MKNIYKFLMIALVFTAGVSCTDSELIIDEVLDSVDTESGAIVRTLQDPPDLVTLTNPDNNNFDLILEVQQGNGSFVPQFKEIRFYVRMYADQDLTEPILDPNGNAIAETLLTTLPESAFSIESNGLPRATINITSQSFVDAYPADAVYASGANFVALRLELEMSDGTVFTDSDVGATIAGQFFNSPFLYRVIFIMS